VKESKEKILDVNHCRARLLIQAECIIFYLQVRFDDGDELESVPFREICLEEDYAALFGLEIPRKKPRTDTDEDANSNNCAIAMSSGTTIATQVAKGSFNLFELHDARCRHCSMCKKVDCGKCSSCVSNRGTTSSRKQVCLAKVRRWKPKLSPFFLCCTIHFISDIFE